jgi:hypothetical protein
MERAGCQAAMAKCLVKTAVSKLEGRQNAAVMCVEGKMSGIISVPDVTHERS